MTPEHLWSGLVALRTSTEAVFFVLLTLLLASIAGPATAQSTSLDSQFVGTWRLVSTEATFKDGSKGPIPYLGAEGKAYLIYTPDHHMCAVLMNPRRPKWMSEATPTEKEAKVTVDGFYAYCGAFEVRRKEGVVIHHVEVALAPNDVGQLWRRKFSFEGDRLMLRPTETDPTFATGSLTWEHVH